MKYTKPFKDLSKKDADIAGGKGASLGEMLNANIPVPDGFVVLSTTFDEFLHKADLIQEIDAILKSVDHKAVHSIDGASEKIQELIKHADMPEDIKAEVESQFSSLNSEFVAVRSSATAEDGADHAWAGQLESYLNTTQDTLLEKVQHCWASLFTPRAIFYRFEKGLDATKISVAVVVQKMVNSEKSGIAFSVHPVTEDRNQIIIEAGFGLGEAIVSGSVTPDSYVISKQPREIIDINISNQTRAMYRKAGGGNEWLDIPEKGGSRVFTDSEILALSEIIMTIEDHYGFPCDIEWALEDGKFYIVQSRPITTLSIQTEAPVKAWSKIVSRNCSILQWDAQIRAKRERVTLGAISWASKSDMIIQHPSLLNPTVYADFNSRPQTNLPEFLTSKNSDLDNALAEAESIIEADLQLQPGNSIEEIINLYERHKLNMGIMVMGYSWAFVFQDILQGKLGMEKWTEIQSYALSPYKKTLLLREYDELITAAHEPEKYWNEFAEKLANKYGYVHAECMGDEYSAHDYLNAISSLVKQPKKQEIHLEEIITKDEYTDWLIASLRRVVYIFDEAKTALVRAAWAMRKTLKTLDFDEKVILSFTEDEFRKWCNNDQFLPQGFNKENRNDYYALYSHGDSLEYFFGEKAVENLIEREQLQLLEKVSIGKEIIGTIARKGLVKGRVRLVHNQDDVALFQDGEVLVTSMTTPELLGAMYKSSAFVTDEGGVTCHAAIVARELNKPCIIGTRIATQVLKDGDMVEVDANKGIIRII